MGGRTIIPDAIALNPKKVALKNYHRPVQVCCTIKTPTYVAGVTFGKPYTKDNTK